MSLQRIFLPFPRFWPAFALLLFSGCAAVKYTVDDGRPVDEKLLANIRLFGQAEQVLRPAVRRSAALNDSECDKQWELPFAVASSHAWPEGDARVAWVRGLQVDERATVVAALPESGLAPGERLVELEGSKLEPERMLNRLAALRDRGKPFQVRTLTGKSVSIVPMEVCRGHVLPAPPGLPAAQDYHWEMSVHPLEVFQASLTADEALWVLLWTQGLSEEAGARMKTYHYGKRTLSTLLTLATIASGVGAAAQASQAAASSAAANAAALNVAGQVAARQVASEVGRNVAGALLESAGRSTIEKERDAERIAAANRSSLSGVSWVAGTAFEKADKWAFERMARLGADPLAPFTLHAKLVRDGAALNAFVFDAERLPLLRSAALAQGKGEQVANILRGDPPEGRPGAIAMVQIETLAPSSEDTASAYASLAMASFPPESRGGLLESLPLASEE